MLYLTFMFQGFSERIICCRKEIQRENRRKRNNRALNRLTKAAEDGDQEAIKKIKEMKKRKAINSAKYRSRKRKENLSVK